MSWTANSCFVTVAILFLWRVQEIAEACSCSPAHPQQAFCNSDVGKCQRWIPLKGSAFLPVPSSRWSWKKKVKTLRGEKVAPLFVFTVTRGVGGRRRRGCAGWNFLSLSAFFSSSLFCLVCLLAPIVFPCDRCSKAFFPSKKLLELFSTNRSSRWKMKNVSCFVALWYFKAFFFLRKKAQKLVSPFCTHLFICSLLSANLSPDLANVPLNQLLPASCPEAVTWPLARVFSRRQRKIPLIINRCLLRAPKRTHTLPWTSGLNSDWLVLLFDLRFAEDSFTGLVCGMCTEAPIFEKVGKSFPVDSSGGGGHISTVIISERRILAHTDFIMEGFCAVTMSVILSHSGLMNRKKYWGLDIFMAGTGKEKLRWSQMQRCQARGRVTWFGVASQNVVL